MTGKKSILMASVLMLFSTIGAASAGDIVFNSSNLKLLGAGSGIIFPDGTTQKSATLVGPKGDQGIQGLQGIQGIQGVQGPAGQPGAPSFKTAMAFVDAPGGFVTDTPQVNINGVDHLSGPADVGNYVVYFTPGVFTVPPVCSVTAMLPAFTCRIVKQVAEYQDQQGRVYVVCYDDVQPANAVFSILCLAP